MALTQKMMLTSLVPKTWDEGLSEINYGFPYRKREREGPNATDAARGGCNKHVVSHTIGRFDFQSSAEVLITVVGIAFKA